MGFKPLLNALFFSKFVTATELISLLKTSYPIFTDDALYLTIQNTFNDIP